MSAQAFSIVVGISYFAGAGVGVGAAVFFVVAGTFAFSAATGITNDALLMVIG